MNILSIDVAFGAAISSLFFAKLRKVEIHPVELFVLALTVWIIYTIDHLMDAKGLTHAASTKRHRFHQLNFKAISGWLFVAAAVNFTLLFFIRRPLYLAGGIIFPVICLYLLVLKKQGLFKEVAGAILYTSGVLTVPFTLGKGNVNPVTGLIVFQFGCIVLTNLLLFAFFDERVDRNDRHPSFAVNFGSLTTQYFLKALFSIGFLLSCLHSVWVPSPIGANLVLTIMNSILFLIFTNQTYFNKNDRHRLLGDSIFLIPALYTMFW